MGAPYQCDEDHQPEAWLTHHGYDQHPGVLI